MKTLWCLVFCLTYGLSQTQSMFSVVTDTVLPPDAFHNPTQLNYGMAVTDVDGDGDLEVVVAGYNGPNLVLKYDRSQRKLVNIAVDDSSSPYYALRDPRGNAIGVTACDVDGDGREEIYFLNTNNAYSGRATYSDKLFKFRNGRFEDLLSDDLNQRRGVANKMAGRSVACVDRRGTGRYSVYVANYASGNVGPHALIEMDESSSDLSKGIIALVDVAAQAGVNKYTGGRGVVVGPILSETRSDVFCDNEHGPNFLFRNNGDGTFTDMAKQAGVEDSHQHGRGVALADFNGDGKTDIVYGNWNGPHRLYLQGSNQKFKNIATKAFATPSPIRTVITADFDNDKELEVFFNNIAYRGHSPNRIFRVSRRANSDPKIEELNVGDAAEPQGRGTGATITDFDGDGMLDLLVAHGESATQPISVFKVSQGSSNNWLRVIPRTQHGAFARGAKVVVYTRQSGSHMRIIDGGSGYLCEMEPVAHFGLGNDVVVSVEVYWPDGQSMARALQEGEMNSALEITYPREGEQAVLTSDAQCGSGFTLNQNGRCTDFNECKMKPPVCPESLPLCTDTYGAYVCRPKRKCAEGYRSAHGGRACVAVPGGHRSSSPPQLQPSLLGLLLPPGSLMLGLLSPPGSLTSL
ncbi:cartilage acidic protein 1a isoform X1 [Alosa sapidissima]|uniref:cartilage acidic protein 1a isoform X1 n=1 Tax=Alosa sapidissima TaxID=34773 RepID=UPI001C09D434|nr:cartilage acidic protein 1a isoform X1 [Alosa sapidissima]XP_041961509.1 cartilage acidic protein 1a isoform X1 [Alosa sapidissima]